MEEEAVEKAGTVPDPATVWCISCRASANTVHPRNDVLAAFGLPFVRPGRDVACIPGDGPTLEFAEFCREMLGLQKHQIVQLPQPSAYIEAANLTGEMLAPVGTALAKCHGSVDPRIFSMVTSPRLARVFKTLPGQPTILADSAKEIKTFCSRPILHRRVKDVDSVPALVESLDLKVPVCRGMLCEDSDDLLVAYRLMGLSEATLRPMRANHRGGEGAAIVSSAEELRQYDFPHGPVVLGEGLSLDRSSQGTDVTAVYFFEGSDYAGAAQRVAVGPAFFGCQSLAVPEDFHRRAMEAATLLVGAIRPKGVASVVFGMVNAEPVLMSCHLDAAGIEYFAALFMSRFIEPRSERPMSIFAWPTQANSVKVDIWTFWARLAEHGIALNPRTDKTGVFPLVLLKDSMALLIAVGESDDRIMAMKDQADQYLHDSVEDAPLALVSWVDSNRRIWCNGPRPEYSRLTQRYNMPARNIPLMRKGKDYIVLPGDFEPIREFAEFVQAVMDLDEDQIIWTSGKNYLLDDDIASEPTVLGRIKSVVVTHPNDKFTLLPYAVTPNFERWANQLSELGVSVFGETLEWIEKYGHKGILHRCPAHADQPSVLETMQVNALVPRGWFCRNHDELMMAYSMMKQEGIHRVVIKPVFGAAGEGILFPSTDDEIENYHFPMGAVNLEEFLDLDVAEDGVVLSPAVHYMESKLIGKGMVDQIMIGTGYAGWRRSQVPKTYQIAAKKTIESILKKIQPRGPGGFDFLSVEGKPVLVDVNTGRFNGAHSPKLFIDIHAPGQAFYCWKSKPAIDTDIWTFWKLLNERGIAFDKDRPGGPVGVFPLIFMRGLSGQYIAVAATDEEAKALADVANQCLAACHPRKADGTVRRVRGTVSVFKCADILKQRWRRVWVQSPQPEMMGNRVDHFVDALPMYAAPVLRPHLDLVVLPGTEAAREHWGFLKGVLGLDEQQALFVPVKAGGYGVHSRGQALDALIDPEFVESLQQRLRQVSDRTTSSPLFIAAAAIASAAVAAGAVTVPPQAGGDAETRSGGSSTVGLNAGSPPASGSGFLALEQHMINAAAQAAQAQGRADSPAPATQSAPPTAVMPPVRPKGPGISGFTLVPSSPGAAFHHWAALLVQQGMRVFGDDPDYLSKYGTRAALHRNIDKPDEPSALESMGIGLRSVPGFVCRSRSALLKAWEALGRRPAIIRPCRAFSVAWEGSLPITTEAQLHLYDFPQGPVVLEDHSSVGGGPGTVGFPSSVSMVPCLGHDVLGVGVVDPLMVGTQLTGIRTSLADQAAQEAYLAAAKRILAAAKPRGPTTLCFTLQDGDPQRPVLLDVQAGFFGREHFVALFLEEHAPPDAHFLAFQAPIPEGLDVWSFWSRLAEEGMCLTPEGSGKGLFPLVYERGSTSLLMAVGETGEDVQHIRDKAIEIMRRPVQGAPLPWGPWTGDKVRRVVALGSSAPSSDCCAAMSLVRPGKDICLVPEDPTGALQEYRELVSKLLSLGPAQIQHSIVLSGRTAHFPPTEDGLDAAVVAIKGAVIMSDLGPEERFTLVPGPGKGTPDSWAAQLSELPIGIYTEDPALWAKYGGKRMLYRNVGSTLPAMVEEIASREGFQIPVARGYACRSLEDLLAAFELLGGVKCVVRPLGCHTMGRGLVMIDSSEQLSLLDTTLYNGEFVLEEFMALDKARNGLARSFLLPFVGTHVRKDDAQDKVTVGTTVTGLKPSSATKKLLDRAVRIAVAVLAHVKPKTIGALHFHSFENRPILSGLTVGPLDPYHVGQVFCDEHAPPGSKNYLWKFTLPAEIPVKRYYAALEQKGLAFVPGRTQRGVFPVSFVRGLRGYLVAVAQSPLDVMMLQERAASLHEAVIKGKATPPPPAAGDSFRLTSAEAIDLLLIRNADGIYTPEPSAHRNMLLGGGKILGIFGDEQAAVFSAIQHVRTLDASGMVVCPGIVDMHVHAQGGGGEAGPATRTPEARLSELINGGFTMIVGILGTDGYSRSLEGLLAKCRGLTEEGVTAYMWTGCYRVPPPTITGSITKDIMTVEQVIGVGEIAVSDHRGSQPSRTDLVAVASECRVAGMLSGKCGLVHVHIGPGKGLLGPLFDVVQNTDIPITQFLPTHMDRSEELIADGARWLAEGGNLDFTGRSVRCRIALKDYDAKGLLRDNVSVSSDACGSLPSFDTNGRLVRYQSADAKALLRLLRQMYFTDRWPLEKILPLMTSNPAKILKLRSKGMLAVGKDADIIMLSSTNLKLRSVITRGKVRKGEGWVARGVFEKGLVVKPHIPRMD